MNSRRGQSTLAAALVFGVALALMGSDSAVRAPVKPAAKVAAILVPDWDRASVMPVALDPFEVLPKARWRIAPNPPTEVKAVAGAMGSGAVTVSWQEDWLGRGTFLDFLVSGAGQSQMVEGSVRSVVFAGLAGGNAYSFSVTAQGQYEDAGPVSSNSVWLLEAPPSGLECAYLIDVNLTKQSLIASHCGVFFLTTLVTSGRDWLPQPTGVFDIYVKQSDITFYSPFTGRDWYPPTHIKYAMEWSYQYYLHTWVEPDSAFGPGSQHGPYASLGCIQVPDGAMASLYAWAPMGTAVYIHY